MTDTTASVPGVASDVPATPYDDIAYPSSVMQRLDPDRLAVIARLHGIDAAPIRTARVLEVGGGDGLNLTAFAAAFPDARCLGFDLAATPVARGQALARAAGIGNIRIERINILDAAATLAGEFDYILVHGVYAWVPAAVRDAIVRLIGRVLAPNGVAMVSYNALPGQLLSQTLRTMVLAEIGDAPPLGERVDRAIAMLRAYADAPTHGDNPLVTALRERAKLLLDRPRALLAHDEFGACFEPQTFGAVCDAAAGAGLAYLNDALYLAWEQGFAGDGVDEAALRASIQAADYRQGCLFRHSLFVRGERPIVRRFDPARMAGLWLSSQAQQEAPDRFAINGDTFEVPDQRMAVILAEAARRYPEPFPLAGLEEERLLTFARLFLARGIHLATVAGRVGGLSERPRLSRLARAQIERGDAQAAGLDQSATPLSDDFRLLLSLLDGTRDAAALAAEVGFGVAEAMAFFGMVAQRGLLAP